jgi:hypothetical protein
MVSKMAVVETQRQHARVGITQSLNASITTTRVEMVVAPNIDVVKRGVLIGYVTKLGSRLNGVSIGRNLSRSLVLPTTNIGVVCIPRMVFTNPMMIIHGDTITN